MSSNAHDGGVVVRLRGLPTKATADDVEAFCAPNKPRSVHIQHTARRSTAEAYVVFDTRAQAEGACGKDKDIFGPKFGERYVRVSIDDATLPGDLAGMGATTKLSKPRKPSQRHDSVVRVGGLPCGVAPADVLQLFRWNWHANAASAVVRDAAGDGGTHAEAFIAFETVEAAAAAAAARHGTTVTTSAGVFQLSVSHAAKADWEAAQAAQQSGGGGLVRLRGVPGRAAAADVLAFFQGLRVKPGGVHLQPGGERRHAKLALVEFETAADAQRALERDRQQFGEAFGDRFCLLQQLSRSEFQSELSRFREATAGGTGGTGASSHSGGTQANSLPGSLAGLHSSSVGGLPSSSGLGMGSCGMVGLSSGMGGATSLGNGMPLGALGPMGMLPHAAAAAAGFMHPALPHGMAGGMPGMVLPAGYMLSPGVPALSGGWTAPGCNHYMPAAGVAPGMLPMVAAAGMRPAAPAAAGAFAAAGWPGMPPMPAVQGGAAAARYMVQDLSTGQKVFLDPRFNLSSYAALPPGLASCSAVATAGTTTYGATANGPAASQSTAPAGAHNAGAGAAANAASAGREEKASLQSQGPTTGLSSDGPETANTAGGAGAQRQHGQSSGPPGGAAAAGNGSSGNGYSVAAAAGGAGTGGGVCDQQVAGSVPPGEASADQTAGSRDVEAAGGNSDEQPPKRRARAHHHHHHNHHHHHHHYHPRGGKGGSSGDERRTNDGSGGGSNDGGSDGGGDGSDGANEPAAAKRHVSARAPAGNDDSSGAEGGGGGGSSGEGSGAGDGPSGPSTRPSARSGAAAAAEAGSSRQAGPLQREAGPGTDSMEVDAAPPAAPAATADAAGAGVATSPRAHHPHSPPSAAALAADGVAVPPAKRARSQ
ncbi:Heterogeneous nuclear ribonucleo H2 [Micractinium conductrix]|uniref:Heterogeneous nuclear ribonucleo H2 n=1 Tax=Micractinium conductrix TaxID=554055 RepID=A0A2P6VK70_9CHLO|nr:Heterogeneous nuclear ribonucleo H2 [Micractinium conductrix]|eukprot:PSC74485.1 Heterogeneous nuclear ribonucleo H2 [Micractinium conductrix]